jgi:hypothetical protein
MYDALRHWLNGTKEYSTGVAIFNQYSDNSALKKMFSSGYSLYKANRLLVVLKEIYFSLKENKPTPIADIVAKDLPIEKNTLDNENTFVNSALYKEAYGKAIFVYKQCMNKRSGLFALSKTESWLDENSADLVATRSQLAVEVVLLYNEASSLFEIADFVKINNKLPVTENSVNELEFGHIPDYLVQQELSNARKALNKIVKKPVTEARVLLIAKHKKNIQTLEKKWHSLRLKAS